MRVPLPRARALPAGWRAALLLAVLLAPRSEASEPAPAALPVYADTLLAPPGERMLCTGRSFLLASTVTVTEHGRELARGAEYALDADAGCLTLLVPDTTGVARTVIVTFRALPLKLESVYRLREDPHRRRRGQAAPGPGRKEAPAPFTAGEETEGLDLSGSKTFGIELGNNRDLALRQSLDLRLTGKVGRDVSLLAILSDQNLPFQPQGNTAELSELDKVLVQIKSPKAEASLGDVDLSLDGFDFLQVDRRLEGFTGAATVGPTRSRGAVASAKGEFTSRQFFGVDGKQGPYRLTDRSDSTGIVVVGGSERIWLDGALLERGEERDYTIDYSTGELTFTSRRVITANSEITADYQVATSRYRRRVEYAEMDARALGSVGSVRAAFFREGDDVSNTLGGDLTAAEKAQLSALGDSAQVAGGTRYVGPGRGDYQLVVDPATGRDVFVYVEGAGDYQVAFVSVGAGKGDYQADPQYSGAVYRFVGAGQGDFVVRRDLPAPERRQLGDLRLDLGGERAGITAEGSFSSADANTLSPVDDGDNQGGAFLVRTRSRAIPVGGAVTVAPRLSWRRVGANFRSPARLNPAFFTRDWNLTGTEEVRDENEAEGGLDLVWGNRFRYGVDVGRLALADSFTAVRQRHSAAWTGNWVRAAGGWTSSRDRLNGADGSLDREDGSVLLKRWRIQPRLQASHEVRRRAGGAGERHRGWETAFLFPAERWPVQAEIGAGRDLDDSLSVGADWTPARDSRRAFGSVNGQVHGFDFSLRYEARRVSEEGGAAERRDLGRLDLRQQAVQGAWTAVATADIGTVGLRRRAKEIVPAPADSAGYFDRFGNYVGPGGGYDVQYGALGAEVLTGQVDLTTRFRWSPPGSGAGGPDWLHAFAWEGYLTLDENSLLPLVTPRYFLAPSSYLNRESTLDGRLSARQTLDLFPLHREAGFRLRQELSRSLSQNPEGPKLVELQGQDVYTATLRTTPAPGWDAELEGSYGTRRDEVDTGAGDPFVRATDLRSGTVRGGRRLRLAGGEGRLASEATLSGESGGGREAVGWVVRPEVQWSLPRVGRVDVRYRRTELVRRTGFIGFRGPGAPTLAAGWRLDVVAEARIKEGMTLTLAFDADQPQGLSPVREGRMEVRGSF